MYEDLMSGGPGGQKDRKKGLELEDLSFDELVELLGRITALAHVSFKQTEEGFKNVDGRGVFIRQEFGSKYKLSGLDLPEFHSYVTSHPGILQKGSEDREEMMEALKEMIKELKYRIIE